MSLAEAQEIHGLLNFATGILRWQIFEIRLFQNLFLGR